MRDRSRLRHLWFALTYGVATLTVAFHHDHGTYRDGPEPAHLAGCADPSPHYAGHGAPELIRTDPHCPACQFRAEHQAEAARPEPVSVASGRFIGLPDDPDVRSSGTPRPSSRAPPLA